MSDEKYCCEMMRLQMERTCSEHGNECPDIIIGLFDHGPAKGLFCIPIHDGGSSGITINYCPWCGVCLHPAAAKDA